MRVQVFNANGLSGKADHILRFARAQQIDIAITVETWLRPNAATPITPAITNITHKGLIAGNESKGGILGSAIHPAFQQCHVIKRGVLWSWKLWTLVCWYMASE